MPLPPTFPELSSLDLFCSVVELGSVSRAARAHGISQPSASARVRNLERQLGMELLHRRSGGSAPTADGLIVAGWAAAVVAAANDLAVGAEALRSRRRGHLRLVASFTVAEFLVPGWLAALQRASPGVGAELEVVNSTRVLEAVRAGRADLGFIESPGGTAGLAYRDVGGDELVLVVAPDHAWARRRRPLRPVELAGTALLTRETGSGTRDALEVALAAHGLRPAQPALELGSTAAVRAAVLGGSGPAVLSNLAVEADLLAGRLVAVPVADLDLARRFRVVWPTGQEPSGDAALLVTLAQGSRPG